ncbi:hypothetical protein QJS10_CPB21g00626 [Acorus calamus]|uniref:Starch synthase catalytic domain-containing protein n=1 Tax=Acorus calamus TaxID=4465 RepID=A0AAV9C4C6_ACOCL|nr:hypothetical protein QJS10_CPB21g00626 [Acorus calamus]
MASTGSLSFSFESAVTAEASLLRSKSHLRRSRLGFVFRGGGSPYRGVGLSKTGFRGLFGGELLLGFSSNGLRTHCRCGGGRVLGGFRVRGVGESGSEGGGEEEVVEERGSGSDAEEDALQATIEKSKKVLAMQKDLLQQIVEGRKLVSSIKNSVISDEQEVGIINGSDSSLSNLNLASSSRVIEDEYGSRTVAETRSAAVDTSITPSVGLTSDAVDDVKSKTSSLGTTKNSVVNQKESEGRAPLAKLEFFDLPRESSLQTDQPKKMPSFLPKTYESSEATDDRPGNLAETNLEFARNGANMEGGEPDVTSMEENEIPPPLAGANVMNIILAAMECAPWSKTGNYTSLTRCGLGDVAGALPKALARRGHRVMVVAPRYGNYSEPQDIGVYKRYKVDGQDMEVNYFHAYIDGVDFVFMDSPIFRHRENDIYGGKRVDILKRMVLFCKAAVEIPWCVPCGGVCYGDGNLVFIANDWHTALLPVYLKAYYRDNGLMKYTRSVIVIHNIAHQAEALLASHPSHNQEKDMEKKDEEGRGPVDDFSVVDLPGHYLDLFKLYDPVGGEHFNIFAAGLKTADRVVTVSHGYSWELKTSEGGWGLHGIINENDWKLQGIVNGIDTRDWNPEVDVHLKSDGYTNYCLDNFKTKKPQCKEALQRELGLPVRNNVPMIGFIGRLDNQKGVDLIAEAIPWMVGQDVQLVMLGTGREDLEDMLRKFESQHHDKVRSWVGFSVKMAHRITAGVDILLMPSRFEPCGLNQLYAMIYGTIPVVHAVGGLKDTVQPFDPYNETGFGWTFERAEANRLIDALGNCLNTYWNYRNSWEGLQRRGMSQDLSWDNAAHLYEEVLIAAKYQW